MGLKVRQTECLFLDSPRYTIIVPGCSVSRESKYIEWNFDNTSEVIQERKDKYYRNQKRSNKVTKENERVTIHSNYIWMNKTIFERITVWCNRWPRKMKRE